MESPPEFIRVNTQNNNVQIRLLRYSELLKLSSQRMGSKGYFHWTIHRANILDDIDNHELLSLG